LVGQPPSSTVKMISGVILAGLVEEVDIGVVDRDGHR
jgi:hypothetical protein